MKKFISMVMAAAMVVSLVPATAFAATGEVVADGKTKVRDVQDKTEDFKYGTKVGHIYWEEAPEVQTKIDTVDVERTGTNAGKFSFDITYTLDNADFCDGAGVLVEDIAVGTPAEPFAYLFAINGIADNHTSAVANNANNDGKINYSTSATDFVNVAIKDWDNNSVTYTVSGDQAAATWLEGKTITMDMSVVVDKTGAGSKATVSVESDIVGAELDDVTFVNIMDQGIKVTLKKVAEVAEEETTPLEKDLKIESTVGNFKDGQEFELKLNSGFEFVKVDKTGANYKIKSDADDDNKLIVTYQETSGQDKDTITIKAADVVIDAVSAKAGDVAKITVKAVKSGTDTISAKADAVEAAKVVSDTVTLEVDEDDDVPVIYSGVNVNNDGITDDSDHESVEVTLKESVKGSLDVKKAFNLNLPEGVFVTKVDVKDATGVKTTKGTGTTNTEAAFKAAYEKGEQEGFEFGRKEFTATDDSTMSGDAMELKFVLTLVAVPGFEGDVTLTLEGDAFDDAQEVVIAKFVSPYTVEASQNDLIIDYRNTAVPTSIVVKEAEAGLWEDNTDGDVKDGLKFTFAIDKFEDDDFEDDAVYTVNGESEMEVKAAKNGLGFTVDESSDDEAAVVTISNISLYMQRNIAAGAYALKLGTNAGDVLMTKQALYTTENENAAGAVDKYYIADYADWDYTKSGATVTWKTEKDTVKEGFINVITAGRDQDDASFTKKVVVPVGEAYLIAGEDTVTLDVPAYINAAGYTMLPVRAVATALGINNNNVLWDGATKTVTILYGQRIITMVAGQKVIYVNGSAIPAASAVEIKDGRTFVVLRDLATALGVTDITWDAATKTATLNGNK